WSCHSPIRSSSCTTAERSPRACRPKFSGILPSSKPTWGRLTLLEISGLTIRFGEFEALRDVSLEVRKGEIVVLLGANGAGKSTLFRTISGLERPAAGSIKLEGREIGGLRPNEIVAAGIAQGPEG